MFFQCILLLIKADKKIRSTHIHILLNHILCKLLCCNVACVKAKKFISYDVEEYLIVNNLNLSQKVR